jgi:hypothetical protein
MSEIHPIRCRCGNLQGEVDTNAHTTRAVCYCRDCRAYAYYLGPPEGMIDSLGGTEIIAVQAKYVRFTRGIEHLVCMSLTAEGPYRWYSDCCRTPIGNTPRNMKMAHVGLVNLAFSGAGRDLATSFGAFTMRVYPKFARGLPPRNDRLRFLVAVVGYLASLLADRISGSYRINPFFDTTTGAPRVKPSVLTSEQRDELMRAV